MGRPARPSTTSLNVSAPHASEPLVRSWYVRAAFYRGAGFGSRRSPYSGMPAATRTLATCFRLTCLVGARRPDRRHGECRDDDECDDGAPHRGPSSRPIVHGSSVGAQRGRVVRGRDVSSVTVATEGHVPNGRLVPAVDVSHRDVRWVGPIGGARAFRKPPGPARAPRPELPRNSPCYTAPGGHMIVTAIVAWMRHSGGAQARASARGGRLAPRGTRSRSEVQADAHLRRSETPL